MPEDIRSVLVVVAHPDDAEFACGGTVAKWASEGVDVYYLVCTNGDKGSSDPAMTSERLAQVREGEQRAAAAELGVKDAVFLGYPDGGLEDTPEFRGQVVRAIRRFRPDVVVTMDPYRRYMQHRDHRVAGIVAMDAVFPYARDRLSYPEHEAEGLQPHKVREVYLSGAENPDVFIDISQTFERKLDALRCHKSQLGDPPSEDLAERLRQMAAQVGEGAGYELAEGFRRIELRR